MATPTLAPRKATAPTKPKKPSGVQIAPEATGEKTVDRILWDLASKIEGVGGNGWATGDMQQNPLVFEDGLRLEHTRPTSLSPIKWHLYDKSKRTRGKGVELWMNDIKLFDVDGELASVPVAAIDHGSISGLGDAADHTWAALVDGSRDITGLQDFNASIRLKESANTNYLTLAQAADATRTITFPDATTTLAGLSVANVFTTDQEISGASPKLILTDTTAGHDDYSIGSDISSFKIINETDTRDDLAIDGSGNAVFGNNLSAIGALRLRGGGSNYYTLAKADDVAHTSTFPAADTTLAGLSVAQTFSAKQTFETTSGIAAQIGTTNTTTDLVVGELTGATTYVGVSLQGSLAFATGQANQANFYSSLSDAILYINNGLNRNIQFRINNADALVIAGTDRTVTVYKNFSIRAGGSNAYTIVKEDDVTHTITLPAADTTLAGLSVANVFNGGLQTIRRDNSATTPFGSGDPAVQLENRNTTVDNVLGFGMYGNDSVGNTVPFGWFGIQFKNHTAGLTESDFIMIARSGSTAEVLRLEGATKDALVAGNLKFKGGGTNAFTFAKAGDTGARTITFPDESLTVAGRNVANTFTALQTMSLTTGGGALVTPDTGTVLHLGGVNDASATLDIDSFNNTSTINLRRAGGSVASKTAVLANEIIGRFAASGWDGSAYGQGGNILTVATNNWSGTNHQAYVSIYVVPSASTTLTEKLRITSSGNVAMAALGKLYFDGVDASGDTYILQSASDILDTYVGNARAERATTTGTLFGSVDDNPTAVVDCSASTASRASLRLRDGVAPTSPYSGDIWADGTAVYYKNSAGVTKTFTFDA